jgi:hypothetical protein
VLSHWTKTNTPQPPALPGFFIALNCYDAMASPQAAQMAQILQAEQ